MKKKKNITRELIEWGIVIIIGGFLYFTGLHTRVIGALQHVVLETGLIKPSVLKDTTRNADYNFLLSDKNGNLLNGISLKGKVVFINFWATWCPPCLAEMPDIYDLYTSFQDEENIRFVMISLDDDFNKAVEFVNKRNFDFDIYRFASPVPEIYSSRVIPTTFVLSPNGKIVVRKEGMAKYDFRSFKKYLRSLL